jgi:3-methyladenine DNA glycosylase/8-oxoguanine DNA glycosylase
MSYQKHLKKDKGLAVLVKGEPYILKKRKNTAIRLIASIVSQQLSTTVAAIIFKRFMDVYKGKEPSMQAIIDTPFDTLRSIGLSNSKVNYVQNVAQFFISQKISFMFMFMFMFIIRRLYSLQGSNTVLPPYSTVSQHNSSPTKRRVFPSNSVAVRRAIE